MRLVEEGTALTHDENAARNYQETNNKLLGNQYGTQRQH